MDVKLSITLPEELVATMNVLSQSYKSQSQFVEMAIRLLITEIKREEQNKKDLELINRNAERLNQEMHDALEYQIPL